MNKAKESKYAKEDFTFFWEPEDENGCFSQWYLRTFIVEEITYCCCEQYMMAKKALLFKHTRTYNKIIAASNPRELKYQGKQVKPYNDYARNAVVKEIIYNANMAKFLQHEDLKQKLLATGGSTLAEASPLDLKYGIGLKADDNMALDPSLLKGD